MSTTFKLLCGAILLAPLLACGTPAQEDAAPAGRDDAAPAGRDDTTRAARETPAPVASGEASLAGRPEGGTALAADATPEIAPCEIEGVPNCRQVGGDLVFAGQPDRAGLAALAARGYRTILTTRGEGELDWDEKALADSLGLAFLSIPMPYPIESIPDEWVERFDAVMREGRRPLVVHCSSGNRVAGLWAVWLAERKGAEPSRALELGAQAGMTRIRPVVEKRLGLSTAAATRPAP